MHNEILAHFAFGLCVENKLREFSRKERGGNFTQRAQRRFEIGRKKGFSQVPELEILIFFLFIV